MLYVRFGSKVRPRSFRSVAMGSGMFFILRSRLLLYSAGSGVNRVQVVLSGFSEKLFCLVQAKNFIYVWFYVFLGYNRAWVCICDGDVMSVGPDLNRCSGWWYACSVYV